MRMSSSRASHAVPTIGHTSCRRYARSRWRLEGESEPQRGSLGAAGDTPSAVTSCISECCVDGACVLCDTGKYGTAAQTQLSNWLGRRYG